PSKWPLISAVSIWALPLNTPLAAISMERLSVSAASTRPSTTRRSQARISPVSTISRPTMSLLPSLSPGGEGRTSGRRPVVAVTSGARRGASTTGGRGTGAMALSARYMRGPELSAAGASASAPVLTVPSLSLRLPNISKPLLLNPCSHGTVHRPFPAHRLEQMDGERGGGDRRDQIEDGNGQHEGHRHPRQHQPSTPGGPKLVHLAFMEPAISHQLEILAPEKIAVHRIENQEIKRRKQQQQKIGGQQGEVEKQRHAGEAQGGPDHGAEALLAGRRAPRVVAGLPRAGHILQEEADHGG